MDAKHAYHLMLWNTYYNEMLALMKQAESLMLRSSISELTALNAELTAILENASVRYKRNDEQKSQLETELEQTENV